ncbi:MAG: hypothetical protein QF733_07935 [Phycisphaerales bacterium]|jgi:hypothetical protein|nr:hypothetical protein [Phycisphaerales bacterium]
MLVPLLLTMLLSPGTLLVSDELGVTMSVPRGELVQRPGDAGAAFLIRERGSTPSWSLKIESIELDEPDPEACLRAALASRLPPETSATAVVEPVLLGDRPAAVTWLTHTAASGRQARLGWLAAPQALGHCLLIGAVTTPEAADSTQPLLQQALTSARLIDRVDGRPQLEADLRVGQAALDGLDPQTLRSLDGRSHILRVYDPNGKADREVAYGTLTASIAPRAAVRTTPGPASTAEQEEGLLVVTHLRFAEDADTYVDRVQRCWVSWDLARESWVDSTTRTQGKQRTGSEEIAIREPPTVSHPRGQLLVIRQDDAHGTRDTWTLHPESPWLPRALRWFVRDLIPPAAVPRAAWHTWDDSTMTPRATIRRDASDRDDLCWIWSGRDGLPSSVRFSPEGQWKRATTVDGIRIEVSDEDTVRRRWTDAGLRLR